MNRLLKRQIKRVLGSLDNVPQNMLPLLESISKSYDHYEDDRLLLERAMDISSDELHDANEQLREEAVKQRALLGKLKKSLENLQSLELGTNKSKVQKDDDLLEIVELIDTQAIRIKEVESELLLIQHLINQSIDALQIATEDGKMIFANEEAAKRIGYTVEQLQQLYVSDFENLFEEEGAWEKHLEEVKTLPNGMLVIGENVRSDGTIFPVEVSVKYIQLNNQGYLMAVSRDITERQKAEKKQQQLIKDLEAANKELKDFAYIVSHDLKAPLRSIGSLTDWLIQDYTEEIDDAGREYLSLLKKRVSRMHNLIEGILHYSRIGRVEDSIKSLNLNELVEEVIESLEVPPSFNITVENELPHIKNDATRIKQVFQNLISNAIKYNDKEEGLVKVSAKENGQFWHFCVTDNGPGIDSKYHKKIFKIFQKLDARDKVEGTGIGLTIVKKIIEHNEGKVWIESEAGSGTKFFFTLPKTQSIKNN